MSNPGVRRPVVDGWYAVEYEHGDTEMLWTLGSWWIPVGTGEERVMMIASTPLTWDTIKGSKWQVVVSD